MTGCCLTDPPSLATQAKMTTPTENSENLPLVPPLMGEGKRTARWGTWASLGRLQARMWIAAWPQSVDS